MSANPKLVPEERPAAGATPAAAPARPGARKKRLMIAGIVVGVLALAVGGYKLATLGEQETDDAQLEADVTPLAARVGGTVLRVVVADNAHVKKGDLLVEVDPADYQIRLRQAEADLETAQAQAQAADAQARVAEAGARSGLTSARANVSGSSAGISSADAQVAAARAAVQRAETEVRRTKQDLERANQLREAGAIAQERLDTVQAAADGAQAALLQAQAQLSAAEEGKRAAQSRLAEAQGRLSESATVDEKIAAARASAQLAHARLKAAEAQLDAAKLTLSYTRIVAPADGVVSRLGVHVGQLVSPGAPVAQLVPSEAYVVANFKETQVGDMKPGQKVDVEIDGLPDAHLEGVVESLSAGTGSRFALLPPDNASGNFVKVVQRVPVRVRLVEPPRDLPLRAGLSAVVTVHTRG